MRKGDRVNRAWQDRLLAVAVASCFGGGFAHANPTGPTVTQGQAGFSTSGNALTITNSPGSIINWQSFSIGSSEITRFIQQSSASAVLNRVVGAHPSAILGALQSNGRVFLINSSGITFGPNSQIDVAGFVASTLNLSDADFLAGRYRFTETPGAGGLVNEGKITTAAGGMVYLVAPDLQNAGIIRSPQGEIVLAAGKSVELVDARTPEIRVQITAPDNRAVNVGQLLAEGGRIGIYAGLIQQKGIVNANTAVRGENGKIIFKATKDVTLEAGSTTTASGPQGGSITAQADSGTTLVSGVVEAKGTEGKGGTIQILGNQVGLIDSALADTSGETGGGTVLVGGDFQGKDPQVQNAWRTYVGPASIIKADAIQGGDGGKVIVWSDDATQFYGAISARGGSGGGNGGFVETSGKKWLDFLGMVDTRAPMGKAGMLLFDPSDLEIVAAGSSICANMSPATCNATPFAPDETVATSQVGWDTISTQLGSGDLVVKTSPLGAGSGPNNGRITIKASSGDLNKPQTLTLDAAEGISFDPGLTVQNSNAAGSFVFKSRGGPIAAGDAIISAGNNITFDSFSTVTSSGNITTGATGILNIIVASGTSTFNGVIAGGALTKDGSGTATLNGANTYTGLTTINAGTLKLGAAGDATNTPLGTTGAGTTVVATGAALDLNGFTLGAAEALTLNGTGVSNGGALTNSSATAATYSGLITLGSVSSIVASSGDIILSNTGTITGSGFGLTLGGISSASSLASIIGTGTGTVTKAGTGSWTLSGTNTYTGVTAVDAGTLVVGADAPSGAAGALGNATSAVPVGSAGNSASLLAGGAFTIGRDVTVQNTTGQTVSLGGNSAASSTFSGAVTLNQGVTLTAANGGTATFSGALNDAAGSFAVAKSGTGTVVLSNANTYDGGTTVSAGALNLQNSGAAGTGTVTVTSGAAVQVEGGITVANALTLNGTGVSNDGALRNISGSNSWSGTITDTINPVRINADGGTLTLSNTINNGGLLLMVGGAGNTSASNVISGTGGLTKDGSGTLTVSGANSYGGVTTINDGTLETNNGAIPNGSAVALANTGSPVLKLLADDTIGSLNGSSGTNGAVNLQSFTLTTGGDNSSTTFNGVISGSGGGLTKAGTGALTLGGANTYSGKTTVSAGTLSFDSIGNVGGGASALGAPTSGANGTIDLGPGTLQYTGAGSSSNRVVNLTGTGTVDASGSGTLTLSGGMTGAAQNLILTGSGAGVESGVIATATGTLDKNGTGTWTLSGANAYTGLTTLSAGTLRAQTDASALGAGALALNGGTLQLAADTATNFGRDTTVGGTVTIESDRMNAGVGVTHTLGTLSIGAQTLTVGKDASVTSGTAGLTFGATTLSGGAALNSNAGVLTTLGAVTGTGQALTVGGAGDTTLAGGLNTGAGGTLTKNGTGTLTLTAASDYTGVTAVNAGVVGVKDNAALGTTAGATTVTSGAAVQIDGSGLSISELITLNSSGVGNGGALRNLANSNTWSGTIVLGSASRINSDGGTLTVTGGVTNGGFLLTAGGSGDSAVTTAAITGTGGLTKDGTGTLTLGFANSYDGTTSITAGTVIAAANDALGSTAGNTTVSSGATIGFSNGVTYNTTETIVLNGTGATGRAGALDNISGTNSFAGILTLVGGGNSTIGTTAGSFTHSGSTVGASDLTYNPASGTTITESGVISGAGTTGVSATASATVGGTSTGQITLGATTLADGVTLTLGAGAASPVSVTSVTGTADNAASNLTINVADDATLPAVSIGNVGTDIGTVTVTQSSGTTFTGTVDAATVTLSDTKTGRDIAFQGNLTAGTLNTAAQGYNVALTGGSNTITNAVTFSNTGTLTLGQAGGTQTYNGGITATAPGSTTLKGTITTSNDVLVFGPVTLRANTILNSGTGVINLGRAVDADLAANNRTLAINSTGTTILGGVVGGVQALASLTTNAGGTTQINGGSVTTTGAQTYNDAVTLDTNTTLTGADVSFNNTLDSSGTNRTLTVNDSGTTTFGSVVGGTNALASLATDAAGTTAINGGSVTTSAAQTYNDAVSLGANTTLTGVGISFNNTINSSGANRTLAVNDSSTTTFGGAVGGTLALSSMTTNAAGATAINGGSVTTTGGQTYNDAVTLNTDATLTSTASGDVTFASTLNSLNATARNLTVNTGGVTTFSGAVGATNALASLTTDATGATVINGGAVTTSAAQTYNDAVTLGANTTLAGVGISFNNTLNSSGANRTLAVNDSGTTTFGGAVGGTLALSSMTTNAAGATAINGGSVTTTGGQTYNDAVTFNTDATLTSTASGDVTFASTLNSLNATARNLTITTGGISVFGGEVGGTNALASLTTDASGATRINGGLVRTTGRQLYNDEVTINADATLTSTASGDITLASTLNSFSATARNLTVNTGGITTFAATVGEINALASLTTDVPGTTRINGGSVVTMGAQTYGDAVTLGADTTFTGVDVSFNNTLNSSGTNRALTVNDSGTTTFGGTVGGALALASIATDAPGTTAINATDITTTGTQTYNDAVTVGADTALHAGSANVLFSSTVDGAAGLTVNTTGATTFSAAVGSVTPLASLATNAGGTTSLRDVTTTGAQIYGDNVVLNSTYTTSNGAFSAGGTTTLAGASTTVDTGSGDITFTGAIDGANNLTLTNTGTTTFSSPVGGTIPLATLIATAGNFVMPASVTTTGDITMTGAGSYSVPSIATTSGGNIALTSTGGALSVNTARATGGNITLTADEIELTGSAGSIIGSADLKLQPQIVSQAIEIGGLGGTGALDITNGEITKISTGFSNIAIGQTAGTGAVTFNTSSFNDHVTVTGGSIAANGALTAAGKTVTLTANTGGIASGAGSAVNVVAHTLNANASGNIKLNTEADTINADSSTGSITLVEADGATLGIVSALAADVDITATTGNLALGAITAGTTKNKFALLFAPEGAITDGNGSAVNVTAANIELVARDGIDLDTKAFNSDVNTTNFPALPATRLNAGTITAVNTGIADIDIRQTGNADILNVAIASNSGTSGNITISGSDNLNVNTVTAGGLIYFGASPSITTNSVGGNTLITLNSPRASAGLSDPTVTLTGGGVVPVNDTGRDGGPGKVAVIERFVAPSGAVDYQITGSGTGDNRFTLVVAGQVPVVGGTIKISAPGVIMDYTGLPPDTAGVINVANFIGQTIQVAGHTSSLAYELLKEGGGLEGFTPEQTLPDSVAQLVRQIASSQRSTQEKEDKKQQEAAAGQQACR